MKINDWSSISTYIYPNYHNNNGKRFSLYNFHSFSLSHQALYVILSCSYNWCDLWRHFSRDQLYWKLVIRIALMKVSSYSFADSDWKCLFLKSTKCNNQNIQRIHETHNSIRICCCFCLCKHFICCNAII